MLKLATKFAPTESALVLAQQAGFQNAELWLDRQVVAQRDSLVPLASRFPFEYVLHFPNQSDLDPESLELILQWYRDLKCRCMVIHRRYLERFGESLLRHQPGLCLAVENHKLDPKAFDDWAEKNDYLTLDVEHLWKFTLSNAPLADLTRELRGFLERFGRKLRHVHLPGYFPGGEEHRPMYCSRDMIFAVFDLLQKMAFDGLVVSEVETEFQNPHELRMDVLLYQRWKEMAGGAG